MTSAHHEPKATPSQSPGGAPTGADVEAARGWRGRLAGLKTAPRRFLHWAKDHRLKAALLVGGGVTALAAGHVALFIVMFSAPHEPEKPVVVRKPDLGDAVDALENERFRYADRLARKLDATREIGDHEVGEYAYVLGVAAHRRAERTRQDDDRRRRFLIAARYLEQAVGQELPEQRRDDALYRWGHSLVAAGRYVPARRPLNDVLPRTQGERQAEVQHLLFAAYALSHPADYARALGHLDAYLSDPAVTTEQRLPAALERARALLGLGRTAELRQALAKIAPKSDHHAAAQLLRGRADLFDGDQQANAKPAAGAQPLANAAIKFYDQAAQTFTDARKAGAIDPNIVRQAMYLLGVAQARQQQWRTAAQQFDRTGKQFPETAEGFAAYVGAAEALRELKEDDAAIAALKQAAECPGRAVQEGEVWVTPAELRKQLVDWQRAYGADGRFAQAIALAEILAKADDPGRSLELLAESYQQRARAQQRALVPGDPSPKAVKSRDDVRQDTLRAAETLAQLAQVRFATREYTDYLAQAAEQFLRGGEFDRSIQLWKEYLRYETGAGVPGAMVSMAEGELSRGRIDRAVELLSESLKTHRDTPVVYRARILLSRAHEERGDLDQALAALEENLASQLSPSSPEWREAKFESGRLRYIVASRLEAESRRLDAKGPSEKVPAEKMLAQAMTVYRDAVERLDEAVQRYPQAPQIIAARHMLAESHRQSARGPQRKLQEVTIQQQQSALRKEIRGMLTVALGHYQQLQAELNQKQERQALSPADQTVLRNCYFTQGSIYFDMEQWDQAITAYKAAANTYQNHPEAVIAYFQIAACQRRQRLLNEARGTLEQAKVVLGRMPADDAKFLATTMYTRTEWQKLLDWMIQM